MKYSRLTNMSYAQAVKTNQSLEYQRLALLEDAIENEQLIYIDEIKSILTTHYHKAKLKGAKPEALNILNDLIRKF